MTDPTEPTEEEYVESQNALEEELHARWREHDDRKKVSAYAHAAARQRERESRRVRLYERISVMVALAIVGIVLWAAIG